MTLGPETTYWDNAAAEVEEALAHVALLWATHPELIAPTVDALLADGDEHHARTLHAWALQQPELRVPIGLTIRERFNDRQG